MTTCNAIIKNVRFDTERGLTIWVDLDYGNAGQGFGGFLLYSPKVYPRAGNYAGHFIWRLFEIADVIDWSQLKGRCVRVARDDNYVTGIGHIIKEDWFYPKDDFEKITASLKQQTPSPTSGTDLA